MEKLENFSFSRIFKIFVVLLIVISVTFTFTLRANAVAGVDDVAVALGTLLGCFFGGVGIKFVADNASEIADYLYDRFCTYYETVKGVSIVALGSVKELGISVKNGVVTLGNDIANTFLEFRDFFIEDRELTSTPSSFNFYKPSYTSSEGYVFNIAQKVTPPSFSVDSFSPGTIYQGEGCTFFSGPLEFSLNGYDFRLVYSSSYGGVWNLNYTGKGTSGGAGLYGSSDVVFSFRHSSTNKIVLDQYYISGGEWTRYYIYPDFSDRFSFDISSAYDPPASPNFPDVTQSLPEGKDLTISLPSTFPTISDLTIDADLASASSLVDTITAENTLVEAVDISTPADPGAPDISEPIGTLDVFNLRDLGSSFRKLYNALTYSGFDAIWILPSSGTVPYFDQVFWEEQEIDLNEWINKDEVAPIKAIGGLMLWLSAGFVVFRTLSKTINLFTGGGDDTDE